MISANIGDVYDQAPACVPVSACADDLTVMSNEPNGLQFLVVRVKILAI